MLDALDYAAPALLLEMLEQAAHDTLVKTTSEVDAAGLPT